MEDKGYKIKYKFNARHNIKNNDIEDAHVHTFCINFYVEFKDKGMINMSYFQELIQKYFSKYNGKFINELEPFSTLCLPTTIENMAQIFYKDLKPMFLKNDIELLSLDLGDSPFGLFSLSESQEDKNVVFPNFRNGNIESLYKKVIGN